MSGTATIGKLAVFSFRGTLATGSSNSIILKSSRLLEDFRNGLKQRIGKPLGDCDYLSIRVKASTPYRRGNVDSSLVLYGKTPIGRRNYCLPLLGLVSADSKERSHNELPGESLYFEERSFHNRCVQNRAQRFTPSI